MVDKLEECPFCGSEELGRYRPAEQRAWFIRCYGCGVESAEYTTKQECEERWNTRTTPTEDARERVKVLEEALGFYAREFSWRSSTVYMCGHSGPSNAEIDRGQRARTALGNKQTPLSLSDVDAGNPQKTAHPALGNKETDRHG